MIQALNNSVVSEYFNCEFKDPDHAFANIAKKIKDGDIFVYPNDSGYCLGCLLGHKKSIENIIKIRDCKKENLLTIVAQSIKLLAPYAVIDNYAFKIIKQRTPGNYTFVIPTTHLGKKTFKNRSEIGVKIPDCIAQKMSQQMNSLILTCSFKINDVALENVDYLSKNLQSKIKFVVNCGYKKHLPSSIIDLKNDKSTHLIR